MLCKTWSTWGNILNHFYASYLLFQDLPGAEAWGYAFEIFDSELAFLTQFRQVFGKLVNEYIITEENGDNEDNMMYKQIYQKQKKIIDDHIERIGIDPPLTMNLSIGDYVIAIGVATYDYKEFYQAILNDILGRFDESDFNSMDSDTRNMIFEQELLVRYLVRKLKVGTPSEKMFIRK